MSDEDKQEIRKEREKERELERAKAQQEEEIELTLKKLELIDRHIENVKTACKIIGRKCIEQGEIEFGIRLIAKSYYHDNSKFTSFLQWNYLFQTEDKELLKLAIEDHRLSNDHHVQFWGNASEVPRMALAELVADLWSRAAEKGQCLNDYLKDEYFPMHNIKLNSNCYKTIREFVNLLLDDSFVKLKD